jgi:hypothetical protein
MKKRKEIMKLLGNDSEDWISLGFFIHFTTVKWVFIVLTIRFVMIKMGPGARRRITPFLCRFIQEIMYRIHDNSL